MPGSPDQPLPAHGWQAGTCTKSARSACPRPQKLHTGSKEVIPWHNRPCPGALRVVGCLGSPPTRTWYHRVWTGGGPAAPAGGRGCGRNSNAHQATWRDLLPFSSRRAESPAASPSHRRLLTENPPFFQWEILVNTGPLWLEFGRFSHKTRSTEGPCL